MIFLAVENLKPDRCQNLVASDLTDMYTNEVEPVAKFAGVLEEYKESSKSGKTDYEQIKKWLKLLNGVPESEIAKQMNEAVIYKGGKEALDLLKKWGRVKVITDDALLSLNDCNKTMRRKLGGDEIEIIPTAEIECYDGKICGGLKNIKTKPQILRELIAQYKPSSVICMVQGINDIPFALSARELSKKGYNRKVIAVNSHSKELKRLSDYHIDSIAKAPKLLESIFAGR